MITTGDLQATILTLESSGEPKETILIVGSCRCVAFINYLYRYNESAGKPFRIHAIEPFTFSEAQREQMETSPILLATIRCTTIFIHEHYGNYGMFNTARDAEKNIYQFGMVAPIDISIPNFHDVFALENDFRDFTGSVPENYPELGEAAVKKFCDLCLKTSFPEFYLYFWQNWRTKRFFWRPNHTSAEFTLYLFRLMNEKFLKLPLTDEFWNAAGQEDLFKEPCTQVSTRDREAYGLTWG